VRPNAPAGAVLALALVLAGCGNERVPPPDIGRPAAPIAYETFTTPGEELSFDVPRNWDAVPGPGPELARIASGSAVATVYAYERDDLGTGEEDLEEHRERLIDSLQERAPGFQVTNTRIEEIAGIPAIEIRGRGRVGIRDVRTRALHLYAADAEYVIDAYADPAVFALANRFCFAPLVDSLELGRDA